MKRLAIIGTGISAMGAAWALKGLYDITMYEKEDVPGGHTNTWTIEEEGKPVFIDSAFMVYNEHTYPLLTQLFKELKVETIPTDMSFSVQHASTNLEFCGTGWNGLFSQRRNIFRPVFWRMLLDIDRFRRESGEVLTDPALAQMSLVQYINHRGYGKEFLEHFLVPMSSAVWSTPAEGMLRFPITTLVRFFTNHCFLGLKNHLSWRTCVGGSRHYRDKLLAQVNARVLTKRGVKQVERLDQGVRVVDVSDKAEVYDHVILACHADEALAMRVNPTLLEQELLAQFPYHQNRITLHTDESVMAKGRRAWSSWNYRIEKNGHASTIYWMNRLQHLQTKKNYFISINDPHLIDPTKIIKKAMYSHPVYRVDSQHAQERLSELNNNGVILYAGAYFRFGFHEDGLMAGLAAAKVLGGDKVGI